MPQKTRTALVACTVITVGAWLLLGCGALVRAQTGTEPPMSSAPAGNVTREVDAPAETAPVPDAGSTPQEDSEARQAAAPPSIQLTMSTPTVNFGGGMLQPREAPYTQSIAATINSNKPWRILVTKDGDLRVGAQTVPSANFTFSATGPAGKTAYEAPAGTQFGANVRVAEGTRGSGLATTINYSLTIPWELEPDAYSATHTYTALQI